MAKFSELGFPPQLGDVNWRQLDREILHLRACKKVLIERERELLELKGPCSNKSCTLHYAHSGPCDTKEANRGRDAI